MDNVKKVVIGIFAIALASLFIIGFGNGITGYSVLSKDINLDSYPFPFVRNGGYDHVYVVVSDNYTEDQMIAATRVSESMQGSRLGKPLIVRESNLRQGPHNLIFVGNPCNLESLKIMLNSDACDYELGRNGMIKLVDVGTRRYLIVTGSDEGILKAATVLRNYQTYGLNGKEIIVSGDLRDSLSLNLMIK